MPVTPTAISHPLLSDTRLAILDGGLGTTLETTFGLDISNTPLWSAKAAIEHPETIVDAHLAFLRAGAEIILTATYQSSLETYRKAGYTDDEAAALVKKCVGLAAEARRRFRQERPSQNPKIALSLGPYGAGLSPAQEFDGYYPPPYGPRGYTVDGRNINSFAEGEAEDEQLAIQALAEYHFSRLQLAADDPDVDLIAFETVPLLREVRAIRMAMGRLATDKPWWVSFVFPDGKFPNTLRPDADERVAIHDIIAATFGDASTENPCPAAIGINCTPLHALPHIVAEMEAALRLRGEALKPFLVLYPNAGDVYDPASQTWIVKSGEREREVWAEQLRGLVLETLDRPGSVWAGVVVGGCCRTGPQDISLLSSLLH
ncbi:Hcy-binding domain-containing protein [Mycena chlorophos]|uniref:Hcy-binding domain-containing protein n=1 Tax=Mycena chlorophos TaxID=658473 RepID=A0A8H6SUY1_MYCCL|nr:Hcy-binding domain-containing protein [Mycena chlorophos]